MESIAKVETAAGGGMFDSAATQRVSRCCAAALKGALL